MKFIKKKYILWAGLAILLAAGGYAYYEFMRGNPHLKNAKADYTFEVVEIMNVFEQDAALANKKFMDKIIAVTGKVSKTDSNGNPAIIFMQHPDKMSSIKCSMDSIYKNDYKNIQPGTTVTIKGICAGGEVLDFGLGTDVTLKRCAVENKILH